MSISYVPIFPEVQREYLIPYLDIYSIYLIDKKLVLEEIIKRSTIRGEDGDEYNDLFEEELMELMSDRIFNGDWEFIDTVAILKDEIPTFNPDLYFDDFLGYNVNLDTLVRLFRLTSFSKLEGDGLRQIFGRNYGIDHYKSYLDFMIISGLYIDHPTLVEILIEILPVEHITHVLSDIMKDGGDIPLEITTAISHKFYGKSPMEILNLIRDSSDEIWAPKIQTWGQP